MQKWWSDSYLVLKECGLKKDVLLEVCDSPLLQWRDHLLDFVKLLSAKQIPLIIFSASGFGRLAIEYLLRKAGVWSEKISIMSNEMLFDQNNIFTEVKLPIITIANKIGQVLIEQGLIEQNPVRRNCLLIGDNLEDLKMAQGIAFDQVYKVGFSTADLTAHFQKEFDLVLPAIGGNYQQVIDLLD
jgi:phosphoserine phosphatase